MVQGAGKTSMFPVLKSRERTKEITGLSGEFLLELSDQGHFVAPPQLQHLLASITVMISMCVGEIARSSRSVRMSRATRHIRCLRS